jgi:hypothetical protein
MECTCRRSNPRAPSCSSRLLSLAAASHYRQEADTHTHTYTETDRQTVSRPLHTHIHTETDRQTDRQTDRHNTHTRTHYLGDPTKVKADGCALPLYYYTFTTPLYYYE